jgi:HSP20 family molecular chaperone IbpA
MEMHECGTIYAENIYGMIIRKAFVEVVGKRKKGSSFNGGSKIIVRRTFQLPADIDSEKAEAIFEKGVLKISVPKLEESRTKKIAINVN